mgnify:CR=1 FL=1
MIKGYDAIGVNLDIALDLPFREGTGALAHDVAKPVRHPVSLIHAPTWTQTSLSNLTVLTFDGASDYLECAGAATADLDFTTGDYSVVVWVNWLWTGSTQMLLARYELGKTGWEIYFTCHINPDDNYLSLRHSHQSLTPDIWSSCFSEGWPVSAWTLVGITRQKVAGTSYPLHYRNGEAVVVTYDAGGLSDPDSSAMDLVNVRFNKTANFYKGDLYRPRIWGRCLSPFEMRMIFSMERNLFGA